jgi:hypothetical protein
MVFRQSVQPGSDELNQLGFAVWPHTWLKGSEALPGSVNRDDCVGNVSEYLV